MTNGKINITILLTLLCFFAFTGCKTSSEGREGDEGSFLYLSVRAAATSINVDDVTWEDRVDELRMIAANPDDGTVVYNEMLYFPDGFDAGSRAIRFTPGTYDFYFIANETVYSGAFTDALRQIENVSEFSTDARFTSIAYRPGFTPDGTTSAGRFLMSAVYEGIEVQSGGTIANPLPLALPTARVELVRAMAKVEVVFRKRVAGSTIPEGTVNSVEIDNIATLMSVPPADGYYTGPTSYTPPASLEGFDYGRDSIGSVVFYIPEILLPTDTTEPVELLINNTAFPIQTDDARGGLIAQRRTVPAISDNSVIRNYHYLINAYINSDGGIQLLVYVVPWEVDTYIYIFQGGSQIVIPPVTIPTDSTIIFPTDCGRIELLSTNEFLQQGLQGAYNDVVNYYDPEIGGPIIYRGDPPYYCEKKYGPGWRLINSCELMSFLAYFDTAYKVWTSNTFEAQAYNMPYYSPAFREEAGFLLEKLTGFDLSSSVYRDEHNYQDDLPDYKLGIVDDYFTPGDIVVKEEDYPNGWPYPTPPGTPASEDWFYNEAVIQVNVYWYGAAYIDYSDRDNWDRILYGHFVRYDYSSTVSRCVREVD